MTTSSRRLHTRLLPCGESALLVELDSLDEVLRLHHALTARPDGVDGLVDAIPGARTVLVVASGPEALAPLRDAVVALGDDPGPGRAADPVGIIHIDVHYDGEDLEDVARLTRLDVKEVVAAHTGQPWTVGFGGFAPGFAYLVGGDPRLRVPRRSEPRQRVPAGAVGLAGEFSGIYPRSSPGGWQLIGRTDATLWDPQRTPPALLIPGAQVEFADVDGAP